MKLLEFFRILFIGEISNDKKDLKPALSNQWKNFKTVKNNSKDESFGIDRIFRFFLVLSPYLFPTLYIRHVFGRKGLLARKLAIEVVVLIKFIFPILFLSLGLEHYFSVQLITIYLMTETVLYLLSLIFLSDIYIAPISYRRSYILLLLNYVELNIGFAVLYKGLSVIPEINSNVKAIYFSFVTSTTLGYGDISPKCEIGQILVVIQTLMMILFVVLFFNKFIPAIGQNNHNKRKK